MHGLAASVGGMIAYEVHGQGSPTVVLVHGWCGDRSCWDVQAEALCPGFRVVTLDLAGHGESDAERQVWTMSAFGADVAAVISKLSLQGCILAGHSMGGHIILEAARLLRSQVTGLIWVHSYSRLPESRTKEQVHERLATFHANFNTAATTFIRGMLPTAADPFLVERLNSQTIATRRDVALGSLESAWKFGRNTLAILHELRIPITAINPKEPETDVESMRREGVEVALMEGVGHYLMMENPERFNELFVQAVNRLWTLRGDAENVAGAGLAKVKR